MSQPNDQPAPNEPAENTPSPDEQSTAASPTPGQDSEQFPAAEGKSLEKLEAELEAARAEILRSHAELENYRKRVRREMEDERRYAALPLLADLLPVVDNLERALEHAEQSQGESSALVTGVRMIAQQLLGAMEKHHCRRIPAAGELFDPHYHEAIGQQPSEELAAGMVAQVVQEGYQLHDRVIRPTRVIVSTGPATPEST